MMEQPKDIFNLLLNKRSIFLMEEIDAAVATKIAATILWLDSIDSQSEITFYINSIGGSVSNGLFTIYDTMQMVKSPIKTVCIGEAYSSAAIILSSGSNGLRFAYPNSLIMIHNLQIEEMSGTQKEIEEESKRLKKINNDIIQIISKHTGQAVRKVKKDCEKDKYFSPQEAIKYGIIDGIFLPKKHLDQKNESKQCLDDSERSRLFYLLDALRVSPDKKLISVVERSGSSEAFKAELDTLRHSVDLVKDCEALRVKLT